MNDARRHALVALLQFDAPLSALFDTLSRYKWDSDRDLVMLTRQQLKAALTRYLTGNISAAELEDWANLIEGREDIGFEAGYEDVLMDAIFQLANPLLSAPITPESVQGLLDALG